MNKVINSLLPVGLSFMLPGIVFILLTRVLVDQDANRHTINGALAAAGKTYFTLMISIVILGTVLIGISLIFRLIKPKRV